MIDRNLLTDSYLHSWSSKWPSPAHLQLCWVAPPPTPALAHTSCPLFVPLSHRSLVIVLALQPGPNFYRGHWQTLPRIPFGWASASSQVLFEWQFMLISHQQKLDLFWKEKWLFKKKHKEIAVTLWSATIVASVNTPLFVHVQGIVSLKPQRIWAVHFQVLCVSFKQLK